MRLKSGTLHFGSLEIHLPTSALAFAVGLAAGLGARALGLPLPMLLGGLVVSATLAIANVQPFGRVVGLPMWFRNCFIPVIGVAIGTAFTADILKDFARWWPSLLALVLYVPAAHAIGYGLTRVTGGIDKVTSFYGTMPGGFIEALTIGEESGADVAYLTMLQFLRLILCIVFIPIGFTIATGEVVGSATGAVIGGADTVLSPRDWIILFVAGLTGAVVGKRIGMPAALMTGPLLASGLVHLAGWVHGGPPGWLIDLTQLVIGVSLGARFAGRPPKILIEGTRMAVTNVAAMLALAALFAVALHGIVGESWEAALLAFAPGGLAEMSLVALTLEISVIYVTAHHAIRIVLAVVFAKLLARRVLGP